MAADKYRTILADPAWSFNSGNNVGTGFRGAHDHYETRSLAEMEAIPVRDWAADDCALLMWVVDSHLVESIDLARAWGFEFKTVAFVWVKLSPLGKDHYGMGYWTRKQTEQCLLFVKGKPRRVGKGVRQLITAPRQEHSRKPKEQYERIEALLDGPYLEMFCREVRDGWSAWGDQVGILQGRSMEIVKSPVRVQRWKQGFLP